MLSEPKRFQKRTEDIYRFVVLNHILSSHFAALAFYLEAERSVFRSPAFASVTDQTISKLEASIARLSGGGELSAEADGTLLQELAKETNILLSKRKNEIAAGELETATKKKLIAAKSVSDQFVYIYRLSSDIQKNITQFSKADP